MVMLRTDSACLNYVHYLYLRLYPLGERLYQLGERIIYKYQKFHELCDRCWKLMMKQEEISVNATPICSSSCGQVVQKGLGMVFELLMQK